MIDQIHQTIILAADIERSVAFYRDGVGLTLRFATPEWAEFQLASGSLTLRKAEGPTPDRAAWGAGQVTLGFEVTDMETVAARIQAGGAQFNLPPTVQPEAGGMMALVCDPDGVPIMLYQPAEVGSPA